MSEKKKENNIETSSDIDSDAEYEDININNEPNTDWEDDDIITDNSDDDDDNDDDCIYNHVHKPRLIKTSINNNSDDENDIDDDIENDSKNVYVNNEDRCSSNILTKYEVTRLLGERTTQLAYGAKPMINGVGGLSSRVIAQLELESKMIPIKIVRPLPNGLKEIWSISELKLKDIHNVYGFTGGKVDKTAILNRTNKSSNMSNMFY